MGAPDCVERRLHEASPRTVPRGWQAGSSIGAPRRSRSHRGNASRSASGTAGTAAEASCHDRAQTPPRLHEPRDCAHSRNPRTDGRLSPGRCQGSSASPVGGWDRKVGWVLCESGESPLLMGTRGVNGFDEWLERELQQNASRETGPSPLPSQSRYRVLPLQGGALNRVSFALAAMVSAKTVTALALSVVAIVAAGATTEAVITGSANPANWGRLVVQQVQTCKVALAPGGHGVGECVSSFASQHAQDKPTQGTSSPGQHPNGGPPSAHPVGGPPSNHPKGGPPSSHPSPGDAGGNSGNGGTGSGNGHVGKP